MPIPKNNLAKSSLAAITYLADLSASLQTGRLRIDSIGCRANDVNFDNGKIITDYIKNTPKDTNIRLFVPPGMWMNYSTWDTLDRNVSICGSEMATILAFAPDIDGIFMNNEKGIENPVIIEKFQMYSYSNTGKPVSGIKLWKRGTIRDVYVQSFPTYGIHVNATTQGANQNANGSLIQMVTSGNNGDSGIFIDGSDANSINIVSANVHDNGGMGIEDSSFLGVVMNTCMAHKNKMGAFGVEASTAASVLIGCYAENDQPPSILHEGVRVFGDGQLYNGIMNHSMQEMQVINGILKVIK